MIKLISNLRMSYCLHKSHAGRNWGDTFDPTEFQQIAPEKQAEGTARIMSFNIRCADVNGVPAEKRTHLVVDQIKAVAPDSVGVQEVTHFWCFALDTGLPNYKRIGVGRENGKDDKKSGEHNSILYNTDKLILLNSGTFWLSDYPDFPNVAWGAHLPRICTWAKFQYKDSGKVYVHMNCHFDHESTLARTNSAKLLAAYAKKHFEGMNFVITGDFNAEENEDSYGYIAENFADARHAAKDCIAIPTFHNGDPANVASYIDFVFMSDTVKAEAFRTVTTGIDGRFSSDHFPIYADLILSE